MDWFRRLFGRGEPIYDPPRAVARPHPDGPVSFAEGDNRFALALYERLRQQRGNLLFSPFSIRAGLGMALAGARGETAAQMREALCGPPADEALHVAIAETAQRLHAGGRDSTLFVSNSLWGQDGAVLRPEFLHLIVRHYRGALHLVDFRGEPDGARLAINEWIAEQTRGRISDVVPPGGLDALTGLFLVNAVHFNGIWALPFSGSSTRDEPFHQERGGKVHVPLMRQRATVRYLRARGFSVVDLAYRGHELSLLVLLPDRKDGLPALEETLSAAVLDDIVAHLRERDVQLFLPRFTITFKSVDLREHLAALGMPLAFDAVRADFSGIDGHEPPHEDSLHISAVYHQAFVEVHERGTEASAATADMVAFRASFNPVKEPPVPVFRADHPFLFAIRDRHSGALMFLGRMVTPG